MSQDQNTELLRTKLALPRIRPSTVLRSSLLTRLDSVLEHRLTFLSAPAGFGKTTLARSWIDSHLSLLDCPAVAWIALDAGDNDPIRFWRYLITACQDLDPSMGDWGQEQLNALQRFAFGISPNSFNPALTSLINTFSGFPKQCVLILEDFHFIVEPQIHETLAYFLDHLPPAVHSVLLSRSDLPHSLVRLRASADVFELSTSDLRFSFEETHRFLQHALPFSLAPEIVNLLHERTEGWVAGLHMVALALQRREDAQERSHLLTTLSGRYRPLMEYLISEVFSMQPESVQTFLLQTSHLSRLTGSLCNAVTGRNDGDQLLEIVERAGLFLEPLDGAGHWYRYHTLFAEAMQKEAERRLGAKIVNACARRASSWYEQHGLPTEAIENALFARDYTRTARLIERLIEKRYFGALFERHTWKRWLEQLPELVLHSFPNLCFISAVLSATPELCATQGTETFETQLQVAEDVWRAQGNVSRLGELLAFRALTTLWQGNFSAAVVFAKQALELLPAQEIPWRSVSLSIVGAEEHLAGNIARAQQIEQEALTLAEISGNHYAVHAITLDLAEMYADQGELSWASRLYQQMHDDVIIRSNPAGDLADKARALIGLAALSYEWNKLERAEEQAQKGLEIGYQLGNEWQQVRASRILAAIKRVQGKTEQAMDLIHPLLVKVRNPLLQRELLASQALLQLSNGDLAAVQRWSTDRGAGNSDITALQIEQEQLIVARLLIAKGKVPAALRLLDQLMVKAGQGARLRSNILCLALTALALFANNDLTSAVKALRNALELALTENFRRLFLDEGEQMTRLQRLASPELRSTPLLTYARHLLLASAEQYARLVETKESSELLSPQELRVLRLLAIGRSRPEIAQELVVSINTVKTQVNTIYRKLRVTSRKDASEMARRLHLL